MKKLFLSFCIAIAAIMTSCVETSEPSYTMTGNYACYNNISNIANNTQRLSAGAYVLDMDFGKSTVGITAKVYLNEGDELTEMNFGTLDLKVSDKGYVFSADVVNSSSSNLQGHSITNLQGRIYVYYVSNGSGQLAEMTLYSISYTVDGQYMVNTVNRTPYFYSEETKTTSPNAEDFKTSLTRYQVEFKSTSKADVTIINAKFANAMPQQTFVLKDMPVEVTPNGYKIAASEVTPYINDVAANSYKMKDFLLNATSYGSTAAVSFNYTDKNGTTYTVSATGSVYPVSSK